MKVAEPPAHVIERLRNFGNLIAVAGVRTVTVVPHSHSLRGAGQGHGPSKESAIDPVSRDGESGKRDEKSNQDSDAAPTPGAPKARSASRSTITNQPRSGIEAKLATPPAIHQGPDLW